MSTVPKSEMPEMLSGVSDVTVSDLQYLCLWALLMRDDVMTPGWQHMVIHVFLFAVCLTQQRQVCVCVFSTNLSGDALSLWSMKMMHFPPCLWLAHKLCCLSLKPDSQKCDPSISANWNPGPSSWEQVRRDRIICYLMVWTSSQFFFVLWCQWNYLRHFESDDKAFQHRGPIDCVCVCVCPNDCIGVHCLLALILLLEASSSFPVSIIRSLISND